LASIAVAESQKIKERKSGKYSRWSDRTRLRRIGLIIRRFPWGKKPGKWRTCEHPKKIEQALARQCQKSEYLTWLNTFKNATTRDRRSSYDTYLEQIVDTYPQKD